MDRDVNKWQSRAHKYGGSPAESSAGFFRDAGDLAEADLGASGRRSSGDELYGLFISFNFLECECIERVIEDFVKTHLEATRVAGDHSVWAFRSVRTHGSKQNSLKQSVVHTGVGALFWLAAEKHAERASTRMLFVNQGAP